jgi:hypothetical protein
MSLIPAPFADFSRVGLGLFQRGVVHEPDVVVNVEIE